MATGLQVHLDQTSGWAVKKQQRIKKYNKQKRSRGEEATGVSLQGSSPGFFPLLMDYMDSGLRYTPKKVGHLFCRAFTNRSNSPGRDLVSNF